MMRLPRNIKTQILYGVIIGFAIIGVLSTILFVCTRTKEYVVKMQKPKVVYEEPEIEEEYLSPNEYSRPVLPLKEIKGIVVHYTANPGTTAEQNRSYFEGLKDSHITKASSNYIIGLDGEIIHCVPDNEEAYASNERNHDTLSIECCHFDETGEFYVQTYNSLVHLVAWLMGKYDIPLEGVIRHYDVTGKPCPKYYVDHPEEWAAFLKDVETYIEEHGVRE